jgi:hypothetical protein
MMLVILSGDNRIALPPVGRRDTCNAAPTSDFTAPFVAALSAASVLLVEADRPATVFRS